jgi:hypothetical protein
VHGLSRTATEAHAAHEDLRALMAFRHVGFNIDPETKDLDAQPAEHTIPGQPAEPMPPAILAEDDASQI